MAGRGQAQQDHDQVLRDGPEQRHAAGADHVPAQHVDRAAGRCVDLFQAIAVEPLSDGPPEAPPIEQEVEAQQPRQQQDDPEGGYPGHEARNSGGDTLAAPSTTETSGPIAPPTASLASCAPDVDVVTIAAPWLINEMTARITTTMTARNTPAVVTADAGPRRHPRRTSAPTNGRKVAARTTPRTIDTATVGMSVTIRIATPRR